MTNIHERGQNEGNPCPYTIKGTLFETIAALFTVEATPPGVPSVSGLAISPINGHIYTVDQANDLLYEYDENGVYVGSHAGMAAGSAPSFVAVHPTTGHIFVSELTGNKLAEFDETATFVAEHAGLTPAAGLNGIAFNTATGHIFVVETNLDQLAEFSELGAFVAEHAGMAAGCSPYYIVYNPLSGHFFIPENTNDKLAEYDGLGAFVAEHIGFTAGAFPWGIAVNNNTGHMYVTEQGLDSIAEFDTVGTFVAEHGGMTAGSTGYGIGVAADGTIYVIETANSKLAVYDSSATFQTEYTSPALIGSFLAISPVTGLVYITDLGPAATIIQFAPQHDASVVGADVRAKGNPGYEQRAHARSGPDGSFRLEFPGEMSTEKITVSFSAPGYLPGVVIIHPKPYLCKYNIGDVNLSRRGQQGQ